MIPRAAHISLKAILKQMSASETRIATMPNKKMEFYMKISVRFPACVSIVIFETTNCIKSDIAFSI